MSPKYLFITVMMLVFTGISCLTVYEQPSRFGFDSTFAEKSTGLVIMQVGYIPKFIYLEGEINVQSGSISMELVNPENEIVHRISYNTEGKLVINEKIPAEFGIWKLRYASANGKGAINVHAFY